MDKKLVNKCSNILNALADEEAFAVTMSLAESDMCIEELQKVTEIDDEILKEKVVDLVQSGILRYKNDKKVFGVEDSYVLNIVRCVKEKAEKEIFFERTF